MWMVVWTELRRGLLNAFAFLLSAWKGIVETCIDTLRINGERGLNVVLCLQSGESMQAADLLTQAMNELTQSLGGAGTVQPAGVAVQPAGVSVQPAGLTVQPAGVAVQPASVAVQPAGVTVQPAGVAVQPAGGTVQAAMIAGTPTTTDFHHRLVAATGESRVSRVERHFRLLCDAFARKIRIML